MKKNWLKKVLRHQLVDIDRSNYLRLDKNERVIEFEKKFAEGNVPRPDHWGGYRLTPNKFEFWQGRSNRLHDRLLYQMQQEAWTRARLAP